MILAGKIGRAIVGLAAFFGLLLVTSGNLLGQSSASSPLGFPAVVSTCTTSQKTEAAADANVLTCPIPAVAASYRIRFILSVSASTAATLGWTATWTDSNGVAETPTNLIIQAVGNSGIATQAATVTISVAAVLYGYQDIDVNNAGTSIVIKLTFTGTSFAGKASATVERLI